MATTPNPGETEIIELRTRNSKSFQRPDGRIRLASAIRSMHWNDGVSWVEVDETPISPDGGKTWRTTSTPYVLSWDSETLTLSYTNRRGGDVVIRLVALDGVPVPIQTALPTLSGQSIRSRISQNFEIELRVRPHGVEIMKHLRDLTSPRSLIWEVIEGDTTNLRVDLMNTRGIDNALNNSVVRQTDGFNRQRAIELTHVQTPDDFITNPGKRTYQVTETFTGRTRFIDPVSGARSWVNEVEWPVAIDVTVSVSVTADQDDGAGVGTKWYQTIFKTQGYGTNSWGGCRFLSVNLPQGQTITSATLTVNCTQRQGSQNAVLAGEAVDSASTWANYSVNNPHTMAATTATTTFATPASIGTKTIDVTTIVQEIINRAGWAANNNIRLGFTDITAMTASYFTFEDYSAPGTAQASLDIVYSADTLMAQVCM